MHRIASLEKPEQAPPLRCGPKSLHFGARAWVMGVLNVTPDSFSDGGEFDSAERAARHARDIVEAGADIVDIGGESTRPGADPVPFEEELDRVLPAVEAAARLDTLISIDTYKAPVAEAALEAGAHIINDISGFGFDADMPGLAASTGAPVVLMHILGEPRTMQESPRYDDVIDDMRAYFEARIELGVKAGCDIDQFVIDPGIGFGKTVDHNYEIMQRLAELRSLGCPILLGTSRKSFIGAVLDKPATERVWGTAATVALGIASGADIVRVHDVGEMVDVCRITERILR